MSKAPNAKSQRKSRHRPTAGSRLSTHQNWLTCAICIGLFVTAFLVYFRTHSYPFTNFDDGEYVFGNPHICAGFTWNTVRWAFTSTYAGNWHPLTWISHA